MSGVFGVLDSKQSTQIDKLLARMGEEMSHRDWYVVETYSDENAGVGLGRVGIGIFNPETQPIVSEDKSILLFLAGEFYDYADTRRELERKGYHLRDSSHAELALRLYQDRGSDFVKEVEGIFVTAIWDRSCRKLFIANDRFGLKPLYYTQFGGKFIFAPEIKGILADWTFPKKLNLTALAEYMRFQQLLGEKNFFEDVTLLPPASVLCVDYRTWQLTRRNYWGWSNIRLLENRLDSREFAEEAERLFRRAVNIRLEKAARPGIFLSGGLDSRSILAVVDPKYRPVTTITYGHRDCRDVYLAARVARAAGTRHHFFGLRDGNWIKEVADFHLELTEGAHSWIHAHGMSILHQVRQLIDVNLSGIAGAIGSILAKPSIAYAPDREALLNNLFLFYTQQHTWPGLTEAEARNLYTDHYRTMLDGLAFASLQAELARFDYLDISLQGLIFNLVNRDRRLIFNLIVFKNSHFENRCPFYDYQFVEWAACLPVEQKIDKQFHYAVIKRAAPRLTLIPRDKDFRLPTDNQLVRGVHAVYDRLTQMLGKQLGFGHPKLTLYADYEHYLRHELRDWAEAILFDKRTLSRGIFRLEALRSLMDRHLAGHEQWTIGKIAPIMTYEMMLRRFYD